ncbi:hypothetical protein [Kangiella aquimarina]|uniref:Uncharacterized protein n=1 Tax=Kangiella aquimarina TaxID=261965 RepID=A0ABZ0X387_9GAMM|nr:hypothetical protein [Kangiella aquimarina]WQG85058.1 hypothetical protein SR900_11355 [Kangiella aquimarina]
MTTNKRAIVQRMGFDVIQRCLSRGIQVKSRHFSANFANDSYFCVYIDAVFGVIMLGHNFD